ncbi:MAG TPA: DUF6320 domain-containing protein [Defluviitaleaceae bacterium]|nr:DUF6320 domain-containing protein [Defluviitaleaceae bacterium]
MPYYPRCGVELDYHIKNCPLCQFPIPEIPEENNHINVEKFPRPENKYFEEILKVKNQIFFTLSILILSAVLVLMTINSIIETHPLAINYSIISVIAAWFYILILLGYLSNLYYSILGIGIVTGCLTLALDSVDGKMNWFFTYALPIIILVLLIIYLFLYLYNRSKLLNQFIFIPSYLFIAVALLSVGLECILDFQANQSIHLSWSLIVFIILVSLAVLLLGLYYKLPEMIKEKIKRKLHI